MAHMKSKEDDVYLFSGLFFRTIKSEKMIQGDYLNFVTLLVNTVDIYRSLTYLDLILKASTQKFNFF